MNHFILTQPAVRLTAKTRDNKKILTAQKIPFTSLRDPLLGGYFLSFDALFPGTEIPVAAMLPEKTSAYKDQLLFMPKGQNGLAFFNRINAELIAAYGKPHDASPDASSCRWITPTYTMTHEIAEVRMGCYIEEIVIDFGKKRPLQISDRYEKIEMLYNLTRELLPDHILHCLFYNNDAGLPLVTLDASRNGQGIYLRAQGGSLFASGYTVYQTIDPYGRPISSRHADEASRRVYPCRSIEELILGIRTFLTPAV